MRARDQSFEKTVGMDPIKSCDPIAYWRQRLKGRRAGHKGPDDETLRRFMQTQDAERIAAAGGQYRVRSRLAPRAKSVSRELASICGRESYPLEIKKNQRGRQSAFVADAQERGSAMIRLIQDPFEMNAERRTAAASPQHLRNITKLPPLSCHLAGSAIRATIGFVAPFK